LEKGSVAIDGISLTVAALGDDSFDVAVIHRTRSPSRPSGARTGRGG